MRDLSSIAFCINVIGSIPVHELWGLKRFGAGDCTVHPPYSSGFDGRGVTSILAESASLDVLSKDGSTSVTLFYLGANDRTTSIS